MDVSVAGIDKNFACVWIRVNFLREPVEDAPWIWHLHWSLEVKFSSVNRLVLAGVLHPIPKVHKILSVIPLALATFDRAPSMCLCPSEC